MQKYTTEEDGRLLVRTFNQYTFKFHVLTKLAAVKIPTSRSRMFRIPSGWEVVCDDYIGVNDFVWVDTSEKLIAPRFVKVSKRHVGQHVLNYAVVIRLTNPELYLKKIDLTTTIFV